MHWLYSSLKQKEPQIREPQIDCKSCQVHPPLERREIYLPKTKCCEFSPLWSGFGVGAWLKQGNSLRALGGWSKGGWELTLMGLLHPAQHRLKKHSLCHFFNKEVGECEVWENRPATCYTFYCTSQHRDGKKVYGELEDWLLNIEARLLGEWFKKYINSPSVWKKWCDLMDEKPSVFEIPEELKLNSMEVAEDHYRKMHEYLSHDSLKDYRGQQSKSWELGLSRHPLLC